MENKQVVIFLMGMTIIVMNIVFQYKNAHKQIDPCRAAAQKLIVTRTAFIYDINQKEAVTKEFINQCQ